MRGCFDSQLDRISSSRAARPTVEVVKRGQRQHGPETPTQQQKQRALQLVKTEIDFIPNRAFRHRDASRTILGDLETENSTGRSASSSRHLPKDLPAHLARLCEAKLLTADEERNLFRRMNYLKYRANALRSSLDPDAPDLEALELAEHFLAEARNCRNRIVHANMRLAVSIVKKYVTPQFSFDELLSEGIVTLMHTVDKFDYDRGFRFSTYAYRSIARQVYRSISERQKDFNRFASDADDALLEQPGDQDGSTMDEKTWSTLRNLLSKMLHKLDKRERLIIRARYALGAHRKVTTFQALANRLGVSKERVRQLEQRAMNKLREMAATSEIEELRDAS